MKRRSDSWDFDWFIEESKRRFPNKFTYKKTKPFHSNHNSQIIVTCKIHGDIVKTPYRHLTNRYGGCAKCGREAMRQSSQILKTSLEKPKPFTVTKHILMRK